MTLTINIDMDGVIYDFNAEMTRFAEYALGRELPQTEEWSMWKAWGISRDKFYELFHRAIREEDVFSRGQAIPDAIRSVQMLVRQGNRVRIVTSKKLRYPASTMLAQQQTIDWLWRAELLNGVELVFTSDKQGYPADVVIDDKPTLAWAQKGALNLLFAQPWNAHLQYVTEFQEAVVHRVTGWRGVTDQIEKRDRYPRYIADPGVGAGGGSDE